MTPPMRTLRSRTVRTVVTILGVVAIVASSGGSAIAEPLPGTDSSGVGGFVVNFLNGVSNTWRQAKDSRKDMEVALGAIHSCEPIEYHLLYNDTNGQIADVVEVFDQKVREAAESGIITEELVNTVVSKVVGVSIKVATAPPRVLSRVPIERIKDAGDGLGRSSTRSPAGMRPLTTR